RIRGPAPEGGLTWTSTGSSRTLRSSGTDLPQPSSAWNSLPLAAPGSADGHRNGSVKEAKAHSRATLMLLRMTLSDLLPGCVSGSDLDWQGTRLLPDRQNALTWMVRKTDMPIQKLTPEIITAAILGFEEQKRHIDSKIAELRAMLSGGPGDTAATPVPLSRKPRK